MQAICYVLAEMAVRNSPNNYGEGGVADVEVHGRGNRDTIEIHSGACCTGASAVNGAARHKAAQS
jgi:hypothetical protein